MTISELQQRYAGHPNAAASNDLLDDPDTNPIFCSGLNASSVPLFFSRQVSAAKAPFVFILHDLEEAGYFYHDLSQILGTDNVLFFPSSFRWAVKHGQKDAANEILRAEVLIRMQKPEKGFCVVTYCDALVEKVVSKEELSRKTFGISVGDSPGTGFLTNMLNDCGFRHVDYVYEPGQYATRGSIVDVFAFSCEYPFRIDFFGNEVDSIRTFEVETQLSKEKRESVVIIPDLSMTGREAIPFPDFIPADATLVMHNFSWISERIDAIYNETVNGAAADESAVGEDWHFDMLVTGSDFKAHTLKFRRVEFGHKPTEELAATLKFDTSVQPIYHKNFDLVADSFKKYLHKGYTLYICSDSRKQIDRIRAIFKDRGDDIAFTGVEGTLHEGFADHQLKMCIFTDHQLFNRFHKYNLKSEKARSGKAALSLKELTSFGIGDYVVHTEHGVGKFAGLVRLPQGDSIQEAIKIVFQDDDTVFVSIHSLHKVSKYRGKDGEPPRLNKLGTGAWRNMKERTKNKIKDIARDLIKLYAKRREEKGFAFSPDTFLQNELEASFIYEDTPDQSKATADVKQDMERNIPMDRLVCGDVGFGKTEVAIRAAFKAVSDNKQVAVLVPTTVLAYQHFRTFSDRLKDFPCRVDYLSRARNALQSRKIIRELRDGDINILIGTHRLLSKDVRFKDLGLLIIDEEQKFGVGVKEKLRQIKVNVDTLTMTATPIPRTLQFSLMGARDLSVISTPPPNRYPIQTELHTFNEEIIRDAICFEMNRNGQVFVVNNHIKGLEDLRDLILRHIPDARVAIGHGQMVPAELEKIILGFVNYDYDVLIATSIIENGIDIPNANTIIVNQAQNFGLGDLHQLRGRVGRSNKKAFCYLLSPPLTSLMTDARRRLQAIENFSDLGSGIHIAIQDLDIRGAGNMLGAEQSGFIADLGYDTYQKILTEAIDELKINEFADLYTEEMKKDGTAISGEQFVKETMLECDMELLLPANYVTGTDERILLYRELDGLASDVDLEAFRARLEDRFGKPPRQAEELLRIVPLRRMAARLGAEKIFLKGGCMTLYLVSNANSLYYKSEAFGKLISYMMAHTNRCNMRNKGERCSMVVNHVHSVEEAVSILQEMMAMKVTSSIV
ncbi:MAG: transcription-repair coupling factor [Mediterranea sp.]|jgi:transcription-repair coupling factor (superfamily II helicase)|nr:transcription-repair coupling factor [Mediterranea sp.]